MSNWEEAYQTWVNFPTLDDTLKNELEQLKNSPSVLEDAFYKELTFGTGGMRGVLGVGTNRMNIYTIRKAVYGLAKYLLDNCVNVHDRGVVVAYDSRYMSQEFALETAKVLGSFGIKTYVFKSLRPTPLLSFAVRYLGTVAGAMITASHNPPEYNGFKVYNEDGGQMVPKEANEVIARIQEVESELTIPILERDELEEKGLLVWVEQEVDHAYLERLKLISKLDESLMEKEKDLQIVFTPLHGTAHDLVMKGLNQLNFNQVEVVEEQAVPDPEFSTVQSPNPEEHQAFKMAIELGKQKNADILLGTDPDADRLGVAVKEANGDYRVLTGNQLGALLIDYILTHTDPVLLPNSRVLKTIVTSELGTTIANSYGVETIDTLTGFKYIGEKIHQFDATGETFTFGYEESYGYLISGFARDKDAVQAAVMACEMAYYWKQQGKTLLEALDGLYEKHGYYLEGLSSLTLKGKEGTEKIAKIMETIRETPFKEVAGFKVEQFEDYLVSERMNLEDGTKETIPLPKENVLKFVLENNKWVCLRPSGTEPKIKCYYGVCGETKAESEQDLEVLKEKMNQVINEIIQ
ncbi:phospho-sugar mutase [Ornithinibacillus halophilus]|uniref:phosphoglucomutase (alpha-D-glucose-1,6-bisphosphate-dependent) n=1 Tax=Ornithinibacillus halophilus TaxID=930117 RepID=A0A1M5JFQ4_9BACI|nr:phospho-sugar mutase [Ornithinibacillus halophilus]SHG39110.1 alpha-phosphoglucomutase [Ornithinibacillus halophilus]